MNLAGGGRSQHLGVERGAHQPQIPFQRGKPGGIGRAGGQGMGHGFGQRRFGHLFVKPAHQAEIERQDQRQIGLFGARPGDP